jgi:hypothetical protein
VAVREDRLVENQKRFRDANDRLEAAVEDFVATEDGVPFLCECADDDCLGVVRLTLSEYDAIRSDEHRFFMLPGHALAAGEEVVEEQHRFHVTQK